MKTRHLGVFYIARNIVDDNYVLSREILANVVVISCEYDPFTSCYKYFGEHPSFPECYTPGYSGLPSYPTVRGTFSCSIDGRGPSFNGWETLH